MQLSHFLLTGRFSNFLNPKSISYFTHHSSKNDGRQLAVALGGVFGCLVVGPAGLAAGRRRLSSWSRFFPPLAESGFIIFCFDEFLEDNLFFFYHQKFSAKLNWRPNPRLAASSMPWHASNLRSHAWHMLAFGLAARLRDCLSSMRLGMLKFYNHSMLQLASY